MPRTFLGIAFTAALVFVAVALSGAFDDPKEKAESSARKCASSRSVSLLKDAEAYCATALDIIAREKDIPANVIAYANTEAAALALVQKQVDRAVNHCRVAVSEWRRADRSMLIYGFDHDAAISACEKVITAAESRRAERQNRKEIGRLLC